jgi:adenylate cyclase
MKSISYQLNSAILKTRERLFKSSHNLKMLVGEVLTKKSVIFGNQLKLSVKIKKDHFKRISDEEKLGLIVFKLDDRSVARQNREDSAHDPRAEATLQENFEELVRKKRESAVKRTPAFRIPIWLQLSIATTAILSLTIIILGFVILDRQKERLYQQTVKIGMVSLNYFESNAKIPLLNNNILRLNTLIKDAAFVEDLLYATIVDDKNEIKAHTDHNKIGVTFEDFGNVGQVTRENNTTYFGYMLDTGEKVLNLTRPVVIKEKLLGAVHVGVSLDFIQKVIHRERVSIILISLFIILLGIGVAVLLGYRFSRPITRLVHAVGEVGRGNYLNRIGMSRNDELGDLALAFNTMSEDLWLKSLMKDSFGKYVGSDVVEMIMANPRSDWLKGQKKEATVLFADIRGFTSYSESREPEDVVEKLNQCFEIASQVILDHGGYIDKFIGDAILAVFGVPFEQPNHTEKAVKAAMVMQEKFTQADHHENRMLRSIGIGLKSGTVVSGNIGSQEKMEYTVIGDTVNVADRLNGLAGPGEVIIGKDILDQLDDLLVVEALPPKTVKGKAEPIEAFKVLRIKG